jgi:hypothetical protein
LKGGAVQKLLDVMVAMQMKPADMWEALGIMHDSEITQNELLEGLSKFVDGDIGSLVALYDDENGFDVKKWQVGLAKAYNDRLAQPKVRGTAREVSGEIKIFQGSRPWCYPLILTWCYPLILTSCYPLILTWCYPLILTSCYPLILTGAIR